MRTGAALKGLRSVGGDDVPLRPPGAGLTDLGDLIAGVKGAGLTELDMAAAPACWASRARGRARRHMRGWSGAGGRLAGPGLDTNRTEETLTDLIRVLVADDHSLVRAGFQSVLTYIS